MKKILSLALAVLLLCGALPLTASAATDVTASFTDANFLAAIRTALRKDPGTPITDDDCLTIHRQAR